MFGRERKRPDQVYLKKRESSDNVFLEMSGNRGRIRLWAQETREKVGLPPHLQDHNVGSLLGNKREWVLPNIFVHIEDR